MSHTKRRHDRRKNETAIPKAVPLLSRDKGKYAIHKPSPLVGGGGGKADGRGKLEQKRKNSFLQNGIKYLPVILERL